MSATPSSHSSAPSRATSSLILPTTSSRRRAQFSPAFTIVELLIVIVVIGILAAITIVAYNGIQNRARASEASSALTQATKKIKLWQVDNQDTTPPDLATVGVTTTAGNVTYQYKPGTQGSYCITATSGNVSYKITDTTQPTQGGCAGHGVGGQNAITNLVVNPSGETHTNTWYSNGSNSIGISTEQKYSGNSSFKIVTNGTSNVGIRLPVDLESGRTYTFSGYVYFPSSFGSGLRLCVWGSVINGNTLSCSNQANSVSSWQRLIYTASTTGAGNINLYFYNPVPNTPIGASAYIDGVMITETGSATSYADGNSPDWDWNGTPHNSTSSGPAL